VKKSLSLLSCTLKDRCQMTNARPPSWFWLPISSFFCTLKHHIDTICDWLFICPLRILSWKFLLHPFCRDVYEQVASIFLDVPTALNLPNVPILCPSTKTLVRMWLFCQKKAAGQIRCTKFVRCVMCELI
jgi:hypothetical protein